MTKLLDPSGELFGQRVIAQGAERAEEMQADQAKSFMQARAVPAGWALFGYTAPGWAPATCTMGLSRCW